MFCRRTGYFVEQGSVPYIVMPRKVWRYSSGTKYGKTCAAAGLLQVYRITSFACMIIIIYKLPVFPCCILPVSILLYHCLYLARRLPFAVVDWYGNKKGVCLYGQTPFLCDIGYLLEVFSAEVLDVGHTLQCHYRGLHCHVLHRCLNTYLLGLGSLRITLLNVVDHEYHSTRISLYGG